MNHRVWMAATAALPIVEFASATEPPEEPAAAIEEVLVTGQQPGPGLWKVTHPSAGHDHVLWILGSYGPLPKKMQWRSTELESVLAESQELIGPVTMSAKVGPLGGLTLLPSLVGLRKNPKGERICLLVIASSPGVSVIGALQA